MTPCAYSALRRPNARHRHRHRHRQRRLAAPEHCAAVQSRIFLRRSSARMFRFPTASAGRWHCGQDR